MQEGVLKALRSIPQEEFAHALMSLPLRWMKCVAANGEYFKGRHFPVEPDRHGLEIVFSEDSDEGDTSSDVDDAQEDSDLD